MCDVAVEKRSPGGSLVEIIVDGIRKKRTVLQITNDCNAWQRERIKAEKDLFGAPLTRELSEDEVRTAMSYIYKLSGRDRWKR